MLTIEHMHNHSRKGEIATLFTVFSLAIITVGLIFGGTTTRSLKTTQSSAATGCLYNATASVVKDTKNGSGLTKLENNNQELSIENDKKQVRILDHYTGSYNFTQDPFTFAPYTAPDDKAWVTLRGLSGWDIKERFCDPIDGGKGCDYGIQIPEKFTIANFHITCGVHIKYGWVVKRAPTPTPSQIPSAGPSPTATPTPVRAVTDPVTPPQKYNSPTPTPLRVATLPDSPYPRTTVQPSNTPTVFSTQPPLSSTPLPSVVATAQPSTLPTPLPQPAQCNTAAVAGGYVTETREWEMGSDGKDKERTVYLNYDMHVAPDQLDAHYENKIVYSTEGLVSGSKFNEVIKFGPGNSTKLSVTLTGGEPGTIWYYSLSCPKDPPPTNAICRQTYGTITGKIRIDPEIKSQCDQYKDSKGNAVGCRFRISLQQGRNVPRPQFVDKHTDYTYSFYNVLTNVPALVELETMETGDGQPIQQQPASIAENCFLPRKITNWPNMCTVDMSKEKDCSASELNFAVVPNPSIPKNNYQPQSMDLNNDGAINTIDLSLMIVKYGDVPKYTKGDINFDGAINALDFSAVLFKVSKSGD